MANGYRKEYVDAYVFQTRDGVKSLRFIILPDGRKVEIDKVIDKKKAPLTRVGCTGVRYTVLINQREKYIYEDDTGWFVEAFGYDDSPC
ncbi:MAG: hypothetical protein K6B52_00815 [Clostridiales bacterium]|nr:hypothetical protein [Clostridiales bacterium]